jgi:iron(III) transport system substrate-binding protein
MRFRRHLSVLSLVVVAGVLLAACGTTSTKGSITLYSGQHEQTTDSLIAGFEKLTGITVNVRFDDEDTFADEIVTEGTKSPADVFFTENSPVLEYLQEKHLLASLPDSTLSRTPSRFDSPQGDWVGVSARVSVLIYNPKLIAKSKLPTSILQLADPKYAGELAFAPGETDVQPIITSVIRTYGHARALKWLEGVKSNASDHVYADNETIADEVNRGQVAFGVINQYYWYRLRAEDGASDMHSAIAYFAPHDVGYVIDVSGAGVLRSSAHKSEAQEFVAFLGSAQGQEIIAHSDSFEYPIGSHVTTAQPETPFNQLQPNSVTIAQLGTGANTIKLLQEAQLL